MPRDNIQGPIEPFAKSGQGRRVRLAGNKRLAPGELRNWRQGKHAKARQPKKESDK